MIDDTFVDEKLLALLDVLEAAYGIDNAQEIVDSMLLAIDEALRTEYFP